MVSAAPEDPRPASGVPTRLLRKKTLIVGEDEQPPDADETPARPPINKIRLPVHTLTFAIPRDAVMVSNTTGDGKSVVPIQKLRIDLGDVVKMVIPSYKPKSYSVSDLRVEKVEFDVTFKAYPNGRASGCLDRLKVGDCIHTFGKSANRRRQPGKFVGIVMYGVGITEGLPVARAELEKGDAETVVLLWASRTMEDTFWWGELKALQRQYPDKFQLRLILSRQKREGCLHGRIDAGVLAQVFETGGYNKKEARFLSVGTKEMMRMTDGWLAEIGFTMPQHALLPKISQL